jgi:hypothetical protein
MMMMIQKNATRISHIKTKKPVCCILSHRGNGVSTNMNRTMRFNLSRRFLVSGSIAIPASLLLSSSSTQAAELQTKVLQVSVQDAPMVFHLLQLAAVIDAYLEPTSNFEQQQQRLCHDKHFEALIAAYDLGCADVRDLEVKHVLMSRFARLRLPCERQWS